MSGGQTVVLDSNNLEAIIKDATGEGLEPVELPLNSGEPAKVAQPEPAKEPVKEAAKEPEKAAMEEADDVEGEDGLTPRQKRELTQKMQTAIGKKHRLLKDAEEFAAEQYSERRLAEQRADQLGREIERLKAQLQGVKPAEPDADKPKRENFDSDEKFRDAVDDWRVDQKFKAKEAERQKQLEAERQAQILEQAKGRIAHAIELVPDFVEVTESADLEVPPVVAGYMQESEMFAELGYHFAKHPEALERLQKLPPAKQLVEIGKIESTLQPFAPAAKANGKGGEPEPSKDDGAKPSTTASEPSPETGTTPSRPRAPAPIRPLNSGTARQVEKPEAEMNTREVISTWAAKRKVNLNRRQRH